MRAVKIFVVSLLLLSLVTLSCLPIPDFRLVGDELVTDCYGDLKPCQDNVYDLGDGTHEWHNAHINDLNVQHIILPSGYSAAASINIISGTYVAGNLASIQSINDGDEYIVDEVAAIPGFEVRIGFTNVDSFDVVMLRHQYDGSATHWVTIDLYNYTLGGWDSFSVLRYSSTSICDYVSFIIPAAAHYISSGNVLVRLYHWTSGIASHTEYIDFVALRRFS